jgi:hypothetical protein
VGDAIDPDVELLPDVPIPGADGDLFERGRVARRLVELAIAQPVTAPRVVALTGGPGTGKTSLLRMATPLIADAPDAAFVDLDAAAYASAAGLLDALNAELVRFFSEAGVVDAGDKLRDRLVEYGGVVSSIAKIAKVNIDVSGALRRSPEKLREELAEMTSEVGKRIVLVIDHVDRLPVRELIALAAALRYWAVMPYVTLLFAVDRRAVAKMVDDTIDVGMERLVAVELALPPVDRVLLARVLAGGVARVATRTGRDLDAVLELFDPEGGIALELVETPRDAKRAINAISAALPLLPAGADVRDAVLDIILRTLVPDLDSPRLDARARVTGTARTTLLAELSG